MSVEYQRINLEEWEPAPQSTENTNILSTDCFSKNNKNSTEQRVSLARKCRMLRFEQQQARLSAFHYNQADTTYHNLHFVSDSMCYLVEKKLTLMNSFICSSIRGVDLLNV